MIFHLDIWDVWREHVAVDIALDLEYPGISVNVPKVPNLTSSHRSEKREPREMREKVPERE